MSDKLNIVLADDHQIIRDGIKALLANEEVNIVGEADNGKQVLEILEQQAVDIVVMDINMPEMDGVEATQHITEQYPEVKVLALSMFDDHSYIVNMLEAGASGYILKYTGQKKLMKAITTIAEGENYFSDAVSSTLLNQFVKNKGEKAQQQESVSLDSLTKREQEVLKLIAEEHTNKEIAEQLYISPRTVDTHRRNLLQKLNVKNTAGLVRYAFQNGLVE